jgi:hypothetical protein
MNKFTNAGTASCTATGPFMTNDKMSGGGVKPLPFKGIRGGFYALLITALLGSLFAACSKSSSSPDPGGDPGGGGKPYPEENPLAEYLKQTGFDQTSIVGGHEIEYFTFALWFTPSETGEIKAITVKIPGGSNVGVVSLWSIETGTPTQLKTYQITDITANQEVKRVLEVPLQVIKNKQYAIYYSAGGNNQCFQRYSKDKKAAPYPMVIGNIRIDGFTFKKYNYPFPKSFPLPTDNEKLSYYGDCGFVFQRTK